MEWLRNSQRVRHTEYRLSFDLLDLPGAGYGFDCDEHGNVDTAALNPVALENYLACLRGEGVGPGHVERYSWTYLEPGAIRCHCGEEVVLHDPMTNTCTCGLEYNSAGQLLAPRHQWGEETGEHWSDIVNLGPYTEDW